MFQTDTFLNPDNCYRPLQIVHDFCFSYNNVLRQNGIESKWKLVHRNGSIAFEVGAVSVGVDSSVCASAAGKRGIYLGLAFNYLLKSALHSRKTILTLPAVIIRTAV